MQKIYIVKYFIRKTARIIGLIIVLPITLPLALMFWVCNDEDTFLDSFKEINSIW